MELHSQSGCQQTHENGYSKKPFTILNEAEHDKENCSTRSNQNSPSVVLIDEHIVNANSSVNESGYISCCYISSENLYPAPNTGRQSDVLADITNIHERPRSALTIQDNPEANAYSRNGVSSDMSENEGTNSSLDESTNANETEAAIASILSRSRNVKQANHYDAAATLTTLMYDERGSQNKERISDCKTQFSNKRSPDKPMSCNNHLTIKPENCIDVPAHNEGTSKNGEPPIYGEINTPPNPCDSAEVNSQSVANQFIPAIHLPPLFTPQSHVGEQNNPFLSRSTNISTCNSGFLNTASNMSDSEGGNPSHLGTTSSWIGLQGSTVSPKLGGELFPFSLGDANMVIASPANVDMANQQVPDNTRYWPWPSRLWADGTNERLVSLQNENTANFPLWGGSELNQKDISGRLMPDFLPGFRLTHNPCDNQISSLGMSPSGTFIQPFRPTQDNLSAFQAVNPTLSQAQSVSLNKVSECGYYQNPNINLSFHTDNILKETSCESSHSGENTKLKFKKKDTMNGKTPADVRPSVSSGFMFPEPSWPSFTGGIQGFETPEQPIVWNNNNNNNEVSSTPNEAASGEHHSLSWKTKRGRNSYRHLPRKARKHRLSRNRPLNDTALSLMENWYVSHIDNPYPTNAEKLELAMLGQITTTQVSSWFANRRTRSCNTRPKKNRQKLYDQLFQFAAELETHTRGLVRATDVEERLKKIMDDYLN